MNSDTDSKTKRKQWMTEEAIRQAILNYRDTAERSRDWRRRRNQFNWDIYNLKQDFGHKADSQSQEFLPKLANGTEHLSSIIQTGLTSNSDNWYTVEEGITKDEIFDPDTVYNIMRFILNRINPIPVISNMIKCVGLDARVTVKVTSEFESIPRFVEAPISTSDDMPPPPPESLSEENSYPKESPLTPEQKRVRDYVEGKQAKGRKLSKKNRKDLQRWKAVWELVDYVDFYTDARPNPSGGLYDIQEIVMDLHELKAIAKQYPEHYNMAEINKIKEHYIRREPQRHKDNKQDRGETSSEYANRKKVTLTEFWGTVLNEDGEAKDSLTNVLIIIANDKYIIRREKNERFDGKNPYVTSSLLDVPGAVEGKGFLDAAASLNKTENESFNLMLDGLMDEVKGIKQLRPGLLRRPEQVSNGVKAGMTLLLEDDVPQGMMAIEKVPTGGIPQDAMLFQRTLSDTTNEAMFMNELKVGNMPAASTKATVAQLADQAISGVFSSIVKNFEDRCITPLLHKTFLEFLQNINDDTLAEDELIAAVGSTKANAISDMSPEERFLRGANVAKFRVRGISAYMQKMREGQKLNNFIQILGSSEMLFQEFMKEFSMGKLLSQVISAHGLREDQLQLTEKEQIKKRVRDALQKSLEQAQAGGEQPGQAAPGQQPAQDKSAPLGITPQGVQGQMEGNANVSELRK